MNKINVAATIPPPLPHVCVSFLLQGLDRPSAASRTQRRGERTPHPYDPTPHIHVCL